MKFLRRWAGLKKIIKRKLTEASFVVGVEIGRNIVRAKTAIAAMPRSRGYAWLSPVTNHFATQNVLKWMEEKTRAREMFSLWGFPEALARIQAGNITPEEAAEAKAKKEAEKKVEEAGRGECLFCSDELVKNDRGQWESDFLLEYCTESRDHKHKPKVVWKKEKEADNE